jgi:hypothetical protein
MKTKVANDRTPGPGNHTIQKDEEQQTQDKDTKQQKQETTTHRITQRKTLKK